MSVPVERNVNFWIDDTHRAHVQLTGTLDACSGRWLAELTEAAGQLGARRLVVELAGIADFDDAGAAALRRCRRIAADSATDLTFSSGGAGAHQLILASMARE